MKISYKKISTFIFALAFFLQSFGDGYYIAHGLEPSILKVAKYGLFVLGIVWGTYSTSGKDFHCYQKETFRILIAQFAIFIISLTLAIINNGNISNIFDQVFRYCIAILYAYVILNSFSLHEIYKLMEYIMIVSIGGWLLEKGTDIFTMANFSSVSFFDSSSPFESSYFAAPSINCCAFFMYYRKNRFVTVISFLFVLLTFKRPAVVFAFILLIAPIFIDVDLKISSKIVFLGALLCVLTTFVWYWLLLPQNERLIFKLTGDTAAHFTQGRSLTLLSVLRSGYKPAGIGTSYNVVHRIIEMDLIQFYLETTIIGLIIIVFAYIFSAGNVLYALIFMAFQMLSCLTGSGMYNAFGWVPIFITFGCINYKKDSNLNVSYPVLKLKRRKRHHV